ncbi:MAG: 3-isopropylmalate dehydrogenase, partial [Chloroflexi bacterium]
DIAGQGKANPLATILSVAMLLRHSLDLPEEAACVEAAVATVIDRGIVTADIATPGQVIATTTAVGDAVAAIIAG